ncbi:CPBP family intramembrane glutamic endopeptidase [Microbispora bryophytorum]|nr:CPBP family intramembrane glutamic endopeptidase [Microbispora camponoti]
MSLRDEKPVQPDKNGNGVGAHAVQGRRMRSAWVRLPIMFVLLLVVNVLAGLVLHVAVATPVTSLIVGVATAILALWFYSALVRRLEGRRRPEELSLSDARHGLVRGVLLGLGLFALTIAIIAMFGGYHVLGWGSFGGAVTTLGVMCSAAVTEELIFRGALFRILEEKTGTWGALAVSGLVFGGLHLFNRDATVWGALAIAIEAGLLFGAMFAATRSLWLPIGLHLGWNVAEGGIFGTTVSGTAGGPASLLQASISGPPALTGGAFGPEASVIAILLCIVPTVLFLILAKRRGRFYGRGARPAAQQD